MRGNFGIKLQNSPKLLAGMLDFMVMLACRTGVIFCVFQGNTGESEASAKRELRAWGGSLKNPACQHTIVQALPSPDTP